MKDTGGQAYCYPQVNKSSQHLHQISVNIHKDPFRLLMEVKFFSKEHIIESESISYEQTIRWNNVSHERDGRKNENQKEILHN